jgi:hypothetical protein
VQDEIDHLAAVSSVSSGLDRLKQQQEAAGYGLRGDMAEHEERRRSISPAHRMPANTRHPKAVIRGPHHR